MKKKRRRDLDSLEEQRRRARLTSYEASARVEELVDDKARSDKLARSTSSRLRILSESGEHERLPAKQVEQRVVFGHIKKEVSLSERRLVTGLLVALGLANILVIFLLFFR